MKPRSWSHAGRGPRPLRRPRRLSAGGAATPRGADRVRDDRLGATDARRTPHLGVGGGGDVGFGPAGRFGSAPRRGEKVPRAHLSCDPKRAKKSPPFTTVRDVDWCNATVVPGFATLRDGAATVHDHLDDDPRLYVYHLGHVAYGDLDGDGVDEAVVVFDETVGAGVRGRVTVFDLKAGQPRSLDVHEEDGVVETSVVAREVHLTVRGSKQVCSSRASLVKGHLVLGQPACTPL